MLAPYHGSAEDSNFAHHGHALQFKVVGKDSISADVRKHGERRGGDDGAADGQPVQPIGQIDCVAGEDDDQGNEDHEGQEGQYSQMRNRTEHVNG